MPLFDWYTWVHSVCLRNGVVFLRLNATRHLFAAGLCTHVGILRRGSRILHVSSYFDNLHCIIFHFISVCIAISRSFVFNMFAATQLEP